MVQAWRLWLLLNVPRHEKQASLTRCAKETPNYHLLDGLSFHHCHHCLNRCASFIVKSSYIAHGLRGYRHRFITTFRASITGPTITSLELIPVVSTRARSRYNSGATIINSSIQDPTKPTIIHADTHTKTDTSTNANINNNLPVYIHTDKLIIPSKFRGNECYIPGTGGGRGGEMSAKVKRRQASWVRPQPLCRSASFVVHACATQFGNVMTVLLFNLRPTRSSRFRTEWYRTYQLYMYVYV